MNCLKASPSCKQAKRSSRPIILVGRSFWQGMIDWIGDQLLERGMISPSDLDLMQIVDDEDEIVAQILPDFECRTDDSCMNGDNPWALGFKAVSKMVQ